jgi:microcystin-dependent protein
LCEISAKAGRHRLVAAAAPHGLPQFWLGQGQLTTHAAALEAAQAQETRLQLQQARIIMAPVMVSTRIWTAPKLVTAMLQVLRPPQAVRIP